MGHSISSPHGPPFNLDQHMLSYWLPDGIHTVAFLPEAVMALQLYRQSGNRLEAGGQLFAHFCEGNVIIGKATGPKKRDWRERFRFRPHFTDAQREIEREYADGWHYVGDWHSHPEGNPSPSRADRSSSRSVFLHSKKEIKAFILVIIGTNPFPDGLFVAIETGEDLIELQHATQ